jgi:hypothetical protein
MVLDECDSSHLGIESDLRLRRQYITHRRNQRFFER